MFDLVLNLNHGYSNLTKTKYFVVVEAIYLLIAKRDVKEQLLVLQLMELNLNFHYYLMQAWNFPKCFVHIHLKS